MPEVVSDPFQERRVLDAGDRLAVEPLVSQRPLPAGALRPDPAFRGPLSDKYRTLDIMLRPSVTDPELTYGRPQNYGIGTWLTRGVVTSLVTLFPYHW